MAVLFEMCQFSVLNNLHTSKFYRKCVIITLQLLKHVKFTEFYIECVKTTHICVKLTIPVLILIRDELASTCF